MFSFHRNRLQNRKRLYGVSKLYLEIDSVPHFFKKIFAITFFSSLSGSIDDVLGGLLDDDGTSFTTN